MRKKKDMVIHTLRVQLTRGINKELLRWFEMEANGDERGLEEANGGQSALASPDPTSTNDDDGPVTGPMVRW
jgi:hypothetical protein